MKTYLVPIREFSCGNHRNRVDVKLSRIERRKRFLMNLDDYGYPIYKYVVEVNSSGSYDHGSRKSIPNGVTKYFEFYGDAIRLYEETVNFVRNY